ncbi:MAG TPA: MerR family transcriptional regulator [Acidimicrobiales bacterium]|nr:MerR family transcriptional regulator [Acidimicrobiales bacterium]
MITPARAAAPEPVVFRIGEVAKLTGLTTRTLRYWEELGLVRPSFHGSSGDRRYTAADMTRVTRIRDLQKLLGFSLAEVRVVLDTEEVDVLDRVKSEFRSGDPSPLRQRELLDEAIGANNQLLSRLDDTLSHIEAFRAERVASAARLRARLDALDAPVPSPVDDGPPGHPEKSHAEKVRTR